MNNQSISFIFIANAAIGNGLSGSDRIFIELARQWSIKNNITICVGEDGYKMCQREKLETSSTCNFDKWYIGELFNLPFALSYICRIFGGIYYALKTPLIPKKSITYIYSCSDFWQDAFPAVIIKLKNPNAKLIGSFYLAAPNPFKGFYEGKRFQFPSVKSIIYWLMQQPVKLLFKLFADMMFVTSEPDAKKWRNSVVIKGGVNVEEAKKYDPTYSTTDKPFDAVFLGRFHPQKGVLELIDIWKNITTVNPSAQLVMIGDGALKPDVEDKIKKLNLQKNVILKGFLFDGEEKYTIFKKSKIVVHPAVYDSGGMASAEAMAWGIPGVSFDLEALKTYYPKGMLKVPFANIQLFAETIIKLLNDHELYRKTAVDARNIVLEEWDWKIRADTILKKLVEINSYE